MAKIPAPHHERLRQLDPVIATLRAGSALARLYLARGQHPVSWNTFRHWGPKQSARFDPHLPDGLGKPHLQDRGVMYLAEQGLTCLAEVFQQSRVIDRVAGDPYLAIFSLRGDLQLLDLTGTFATKMGASLGIHSGPRDRSRMWARALYEAYPDIHGLLYWSSMHPGARAVALFERGFDSLPQRPDFNRALADHSLTDTVDACAEVLGYLRR